jgi:hypothetical protein
MSKRSKKWKPSEEEAFSIDECFQNPVLGCIKGQLIADEDTPDDEKREVNIRGNIIPLERKGIVYFIMKGWRAVISGKFFKMFLNNKMLMVHVPRKRRRRKRKQLTQRKNIRVYI